MSVISLVDIDRQWFKSKIGMGMVSETHRDDALCAYAILEGSDDVFVVPDTHLDKRFRHSKLVTSAPNIRFYAGAALIVGGQKVGTLCIMDSSPRNDFSRDDAIILRDLARLVENILETRRQATLDSQNDLVRMVCVLLQTVSAYGLDLSRQQEEVRRSLSQYDMHNEFHMYQLLHQCESLREQVLLLDEAIEAVSRRMNMYLMHIYLPHSSHAPTTAIHDKTIDAYIYTQNQCVYGSGIYSNHVELLDMQEEMYMQTFRMMEVVEKLKHTLRWPFAKLSWSHDHDGLEEDRGLYSRLKVNPAAQTMEICWGERAFYIPYTVLDLALFTLLSHIHSSANNAAIGDNISVACAYEVGKDIWEKQKVFTMCGHGMFLVTVTHAPEQCLDENNMLHTDNTVHHTLHHLLHATGGSYTHTPSTGTYSIRVPCVCLPYQPPMSPLSTDSVCTDIEYGMCVDRDEGNDKATVRYREEDTDSRTRSPKLVLDKQNINLSNGILKAGLGGYRKGGNILGGLIRMIYFAFSSNKVMPM